MIEAQRLALVLLALIAAAGAEAQPSALSPGAPQGASDFTPWTFREDFSKGIPGWMSFPLPQDAGYDPTIYTTQVSGSPLLVRDATSFGERLLRVGLVKPLIFHIAPSSSIRIKYGFETCGIITGGHLSLGTVKGRRYIHSLSFEPGAHDVQVNGGQLEIPAAGADVEVIVLEAEVATPPAGSHSRLTLRTLEIHAEKPVGELIRAPHLDRPIGKVPSHPRVLLTAGRLEQLRSQPYSSGLLAIVHRRASELRNSLAFNLQAGQNIAQLPLTSLLPGLVEYFSLMDSYSDAISFNALDFRLNGDRTAMQATRRALLTVCAWPTWTPPWFNAKGIHTYYEVGVFTQKVSFGYDLIADELSPGEKSTIADALWKLSIQPTLDDYFFYDRLPIAVSNHEAQSVGGAIEACVALYGDIPDWTTRFEPALAELVVAYERLLDGLFPGDGSEAEPAGYEQFAMEGLSWGMAALHALDIRPRGSDKMMKAFWWPRYAQVRPDLVLDTGDFRSELKALAGFAWGAEYSGDAALRAFYDTATDASLEGVFGAGHAGGTVDQAPGLLDLVCCTHPSGLPPEEPPSRIFPARGSAVLRSGWLPQDTVISLRAGPWFNHEHHDQGSFRVAAYGEELVAEAGYADYYKDPRYQDYFTQAPAHNTVVIDDDPFSQEDYDGRYWAAFQNFAKIERHVLSPHLDYLVADLAPVYGDASRILRLTREYLFVKPAVLIIHDRIEAAIPHEYSWFLHVPPGAQTNAGADQALIRGKAAFAVLSAAGENTHWRRQPQPVPTRAYIDFDRIPVLPREAFRLDSPREKESDFLVAMHFQRDSEEAGPLLPLRTPSADGFRLRNADGWTIALFRRNGGPLMVEGVSADASSLALIERGDSREEIFAAQVRSLRRGQQLFFSASAAVDAVLGEVSSFTEVHVTCRGETDLRIFPKKTPVQVVVDQLRSAPNITEGFISLPHLPKGDHMITIGY